MAEAAPRWATYADLEAVPDHLVAEIVDGVLEAHPRPGRCTASRRRGCRVSWIVRSPVGAVVLVAGSS